MTRLWLFLVLALPVAAQQYSLPNTNAGFPATARQITWQAGSDIWNGGVLPSYTPASCSATCDGATDATSQINACITAATSGQAVVLPAGSCYVNGTVRLKSNMSLRGSGTVNTAGSHWMPTADATVTTLLLGASARLTTQNFSFSSNLTPGTSYGVLPSTCGITGSPIKGDTQITITSGGSCALSVGSHIKVFGNDNPALINATGTDGLCQWCADNTGYYALQQMEDVVSFASGTGGAGSVVNLSTPLTFTPDTTARTVNGQSEPAGPKYNIITYGTVHAGFENFRVNGSAHDVGGTSLLELQGCYECWILGVETYMTGGTSGSAHVNVQESYAAEIRDSALHDQRSGASGAGYGIHIYFANGFHKFENNIIRHNRHAIVFEGGGNGDFIGYNYMDDGYTDDLTYFASTRSSHGAHPIFQLWEGNIISHFTADDYWGTSSHDVLFRNWLRGGEPNANLGGGGTIASFPPNSGFLGVDLYQWQSYYAFVDNVLGNPGLGAGVSGAWSSATLSATCAIVGGSDQCGGASSSTPLVYGYGNDTTEGAASSATIIRQGNYDYKTLGVAFNDGGAGLTYQNSYYYASKPSFLGSCAWPAFGSDVAGIANATNLPAYNTAMGTNCSAVISGSGWTVFGLTQKGLTNQ